MSVDALDCGSVAPCGCSPAPRPSASRLLLAPLLAALLLPACMAQMPAAVAATLRRPRPPEYRLGPGDELSLSFPLNPELNHDGPVGPDGRFTVPLVGTLLIEGDTIAEAASAIAVALREARIVADAHPSLTVRHYNAAIYVGGEVNKPGVLQLSAGMDALQAVIAAGGLLDTAKTRHIALIRRDALGRASVFFVDLRAYMRGNVSVPMIELQPRDVVFVPKSSIGEADKWVDLYLNKLLPFGKSFNYNLGNYPATTVP